jgi:Recombinase
VSLQDPSTFENIVLAAVMGERNSEDSKRKSLATKAGLRARREKGLWGGGPRPYGYDYDKQSEMLVPLKAEAVVVVRAFNEFAGGKSLSAISRTLEADNVAPRRGRHWRASTIGQILSNPVYVGKMRHADEVFDGVHEPIVEQKLWDEAQVLLQARRKKGRGRPPKGNHLLRGGLLKCTCGGTRICRSDSRRSDYEVYVCERRHMEAACDSPILPRRVVDGALYAYFEQVGLDVDATRAQLVEARDRKLDEVRALSSQAETEKRRAEDRLTRVRRDYQDGKITAEDWSDFREELSAEMEGATAEVERLIKQVAEAESWGILQDAEHDTLARLSGLRAAMAGEINDAEGVNAVRAALTRLFDHFVLREAEPGTRIHADLAWQGDLIIEPVIREEVIEGFTNYRPIFRREPLYSADKKYGVAHASRLRRKLDPEHGRYVVNCWGYGYRLIDG